LNLQPKAFKKIAIVQNIAEKQWLIRLG
jgi:hypothetical protein